MQPLCQNDLVTLWLEGLEGSEYRWLIVLAEVRSMAACVMSPGLWHARWPIFLSLKPYRHDRGLGNGTSQRQGSCRGRLAMPRGGLRHLNKACGLFNRDTAGWHYGRSASMHIDVLSITMRSMGGKLSISKYRRRQKQPVLSYVPTKNRISCS